MPIGLSDFGLKKPTSLAVFIILFLRQKISTLLIDIHTHFLKSTADFSIFNVDQTGEIPEHKQHVSAGLHPWSIDEITLSEKLNTLEKLIHDPRVLFIGECGLDKVCSADFELQIRAFKSQIDLANQLKKPLMIHCVRAHNEVIQLLTASKNTTPVVFHGFNKNRQIADMIMQHGYYMSFGEDLFKDQVSSVFATLPVDRIFLESDDKKTDIALLYKHAATLLNISPDQLEAQITINLRTILGPEFNVV